jgi:hypothetical protein
VLFAKGLGMIFGGIHRFRRQDDQGPRAWRRSPSARRGLAIAPTRSYRERNRKHGKPINTAKRQ